MALPLQVDAWRCGWSVPRLALPLMPCDSGHKEDVGKGKARYGGGHPKGHGLGSLVDLFPVSAPSDLQCSPQAQPEHLAKAAGWFSPAFPCGTNFVFDSSAWSRTHCMPGPERSAFLCLPSVGIKGIQWEPLSFFVGEGLCCMVGCLAVSLASVS